MSEITNQTVDTIFDSRGAKEIGSGSDSTVFRQGDRVYKVYKQYRNNLSVAKIQRYAQAVNQAAAWGEEFVGRGVVSVGGEVYGMSRMVTPIMRVGESTLGSLVVEAEYVPGPRLAALELSLYGLRQELDSVGDEKEREFLEKLAKEFHERKYLVREFETQVERMAKDIGTKLGTYSGIDIGIDNVKVRVDLSEKKIKLLITDLCTELKDFN